MNKQMNGWQKVAEVYIKIIKSIDYVQFYVNELSKLTIFCLLSTMVSCVSEMHWEVREQIDVHANNLNRKYDR